MPHPRFIDWAQPLPSHYLMAGDLFTSDEACVVTTILGSCVAVTMLHAKSGLAAICHAMLPEPRSAEDAAPDSPDRFKYVTVVLPAMLDFFAREGITARHIEVKIFGGANVLQMLGEPGASIGVGQANINMTRTMLAAANVRVHVGDVGGTSGRKILFNTLSGRVLLKYLDSAAKRGVAVDR